MWFLFGEVSSSSGCFGWATLFHCGTPRAFHIIILQVSLSDHLWYFWITTMLHDRDKSHDLVDLNKPYNIVYCRDVLL